MTLSHTALEPTFVLSGVHPFPCSSSLASFLSSLLVCGSVLQPLGPFPLALCFCSPCGRTCRPKKNAMSLSCLKPLGVSHHSQNVRPTWTAGRKNLLAKLYFLLCLHLSSLFKDPTEAQEVAHTDTITSWVGLFSFFKISTSVFLGFF